jgi:tetratricopeptide (TPR) repeat protein
LRAHTETTASTASWRGPACLLAALAVAGSPATASAARRDAARPAEVEVTREATGFTITQDLRVSGAVRTDYEAAVRMLQQERYQEGIALLTRVTEAAPGAIAPYVDLGIAYGRVGDLDRAELSLKRALEIDPGHPIANNELGMIYRRQGRFADARASYEKALELYPSFHYAHRNLAILCDLYLQDFPCALQHYEAYRQAVPGDRDAVRWIADVQNRADE